jgi:molybdopterin molybdotransferase
MLEFPSKTLEYLSEEGGLTMKSAQAICEMLLPGINGVAVAITDTTTILGYAGVSEDGNPSGRPIRTQATRDTVADGEKRIMLTAQDIGALAAMGITQVPVSCKVLVGILSTGDELVPVEATPRNGQVRDVNSAMLRALCEECGAEVINYGIFKDDEALLSAAVDKALGECDAVLISGGSSVGMKDATCRVIESKGELLLHGIAMKPGKPTILGKVDSKPIAGLPGHPVAAFFVSHLFIRPLLQRLMGRELKQMTVSARLTEAISANHGRAEYMGVHLETRQGEYFARPIHGKSGLITTLAAADGYLSISRDCEGLAKDTIVPITIFSVD